jgi:hypothetical protein
MKKVCILMAVFAVLAGYQSTYAAESKDGKSYTTIADGVRSVAVMDSKGGVKEKRFEIYIDDLEGWYDAVKGSDGYKISIKGQNNVDMDAQTGGC